MMLMGLFKRLVVFGLLYIFFSTVLSTYLPGWVWSIIEPWLPFVLILAAFVPGLSAPVVKTLLLYSSPFWVWALAQYLLAASPLGAALPDGPEYTVALTVAAPSGVAIVGWLYWYLLRWQELSRTAILPVALIYHLSAVTLTIIAGVMTPTVWAWALGSLAITFTLSASMNPERRALFGYSAAFCVSATVALGVLL